MKRPYVPRHLRDTTMTPRMRQVLTFIQSQPGRVARHQIEAALQLQRLNVMELLRALRRMGAVESDKAGRSATWASTSAVNPAHAPEEVECRPFEHILRPAGTWKASVTRPQAWHP